MSNSIRFNELYLIVSKNDKMILFNNCQLLFKSESEALQYAKTSFPRKSKKYQIITLEDYNANLRSFISWSTEISNSEYEANTHGEWR